MKAQNIRGLVPEDQIVTFMLWKKSSYEPSMKSIN